MEPQENPYASPTADLEPERKETTDAEAVREKHIHHENLIRQIGCLYYFVATLAFAGLVLTALPFAAIPPPIDLKTVGSLLFEGALVALMVYIGHGLRQFSPKARIVTGIYAAVGMLWVPVGTIVNGLILFSLFCRKGRMVFSPEYQNIIRQAPYVKAKTSPFVLFLLILLTAFLGLCMLYLLLTPIIHM